MTTVSGNAPLEKTTRNALLTCQLLGLEVAIHAGASRPLIAEPRHAEFIHGASGLDGPALPPLTREPAGSDAAGFIVESASNHSDLWLVATGPLTNVAAALLRDPELADRLAGIAIMGGGSTFGNVTAAAEFNILSDPEAADRVFRSGANLVLADLNLTHQFLLGGSHIDRIRRAGRSRSDVRRRPPYLLLHGLRQSLFRQGCGGRSMTRRRSSPSATRNCSNASGATPSSSFAATTPVG